MLSLDARRALIDLEDEHLSVLHQCRLLSVARSTFYYTPLPVDPLTHALMKAIDREYLKHPFFGVRRMTLAMRDQGYPVNHKRITRLMHVMGLQAVYAGPKTSNPAKDHKIYPYLLRGLEISQRDQVWSTDLTYVPMASGFMYLVAIIDWFTRYVLAWGISNTRSADFCVRVLKEALRKGAPRIFNTDQGSEFTSETFTAPLLDAKIAISMDGRGRALDNVFIERLWRSVKYEDIYLKNYDTATELMSGLRAYFAFYNNDRRHQSLDDRTPAELYLA